MRNCRRNIMTHLDLSKGRAQPWSDCHKCNMPFTGHGPWAGTALSELHAAGVGLRQAGGQTSVPGVVLHQLRICEQAGTQPGPAELSGRDEEGSYKPWGWQRELLMPEWPSLCTGVTLAALRLGENLGSPGSHVFLGALLLFHALCSHRHAKLQYLKKC